MFIFAAQSATIKLMAVMRFDKKRAAGSDGHRTRRADTHRNLHRTRSIQGSAEFAVVYMLAILKPGIWRLST